MKKADIEKQLAEHPDTVFQIDRSQYIITRVVQEKNQYNMRAMPTWRVYVKSVRLDEDTNELQIGDESRYTYPLGQVHYARWNTLEETKTALIDIRQRWSDVKSVEKKRRENFPAIQKELQDLARWFGIEKMWVEDTWGNDQTKISMTFNDAYKLIALMQASLDVDISNCTSGITTGETK
jgi:hypothetical protein